MLNTDQIQTHFGLKITAAFIEDELGIKADKAEKRARYWEASAVPKIGEALAKHAVKRGSATPETASPAPAPAPAPAADDDNSDLF